MGTYIKSKPANSNQDFRRLLLDKLHIVRDGHITVIKQDGKVVQIDVCSRLRADSSLEKTFGSPRDNVVVRGTLGQ
jgi:hypothetical protein